MMDKNNKKGYVIGGIVLVILVVLLIIVWKFNTLNDGDIQNTNNYEAKQYKTFVEELSSYTEGINSELDYDTAKMEIISEVMSKQKTYEDGNGVGYASNLIINTISADNSNSTSDLLETLNSLLDNLLDGIFADSNSNLTTTLTMKSNTACNDDDIDAKYCVEKLSAKVYVVDANSDKWAVLIHGNMMNGKQMYSAVGSMYTEQGYNVIAPDLRGFGDSDGSVAMGYLESLDVYDWIKDLNHNWQSKYGVNVAPETIVVHGISLGGATTLQLATNPDIASASGKEPYTYNLTQLNVKGFVDDCGYTSMSGIITGMLSIGDSAQMSTILSSLGISEIDFMSELKKQAEKLDISGLKDIDIDDLVSGKDTDYLKYLEQFNNEFNKVADELQKYESSNGSYQISGLDIDSIKDALSGLIPTSSINNSRGNLVKMNSSLNIDTSGVLNGLVGKVLMNLVGLGLTDDNYNKYSDVFSEGRTFPQESKVVIIHGTSDTTVPHSNADTVASNISPATLLHKWDADGMPHAFIVVGSNKTEYTNLITNFTNCVTDTSCTNISR